MCAFFFCGQCNFVKLTDDLNVRCNQSRLALIFLVLLFFKHVGSWLIFSYQSFGVKLGLILNNLTVFTPRVFFLIGDLEPFIEIFIRTFNELIYLLVWRSAFNLTLIRFVFRFLFDLENEWFDLLVGRLSLRCHFFNHLWAISTMQLLVLWGSLTTNVWGLDFLLLSTPEIAIVIRYLLRRRLTNILLSPVSPATFSYLAVIFIRARIIWNS